MRDNLTFTDVVPHHLDVIVPVRAGLLMVEAEGVQQLVLHSAVIETTLTAERHCLATALTAHPGVAAACTNRTAFTNQKWFHHSGTETLNGKVIVGQKRDRLLREEQRI